MLRALQSVRTRRTQSASPHLALGPIPLRRTAGTLRCPTRGETAAVWDAVHRIAFETGAAVIVIHHSRKGDRSPTMESIRGSFRAAGEVDLMLIVNKRDAGTLELFLEGRDLVQSQADNEAGNLEVRYERDGPWQMRLSGARITVKGAKGKGKENKTRPAVAQVLKATAEPLRVADIHDRVESILGETRSRQAIKNELRTMEADGEAHRKPNPNGKGEVWLPMTSA
jgi:hypothetical protein